MIGVGVFLTPHMVAAAVGTGSLYFGMWLLGALVALAGALAVGELGTLLPHSGGDYIYLREAHGEGAAFLYGWLSLLAAFSGAAAAAAVGIPRYQGGVLFGGDWNVTLLEVGAWRLAVDQLVGIGLVWLLTGLACLRVHVAGRIQLGLVLTAVGVLACGALWAFGDPRPPIRAPFAPAELDGLAAAQSFTGVFFAYTGWNAAGYVASELREPGRDLPWALVVATVTVAVLYLLLNAAFVDVLGDLRPANEAGSATAVALFGAQGGRAMAAVIALAVTGALLATLVGGARVYAAMARDGLFFGWAARLHPRWGTPVASLVVQAAWTSVLIASSTFDALLRWSSLAMMLLSMLTVLAVPVLRRRHPHAQRPFRSPWQPWLTVVYVVPCTVVLMASAWASPWQSLLALAGAGALGWWLFHRQGRGRAVGQ
jgi:APA family basic amino acid/polyamine antiporter